MKLESIKIGLESFILFIFFSEMYAGSENEDCCKVLNTEVKIQKLDFLLRNPDYLCFELLEVCNRNDVDKNEIKGIVKNIFYSHEPQIRRLEMERFFFGAYEDIDEVIAFLVTVGFIKYKVQRNSVLKLTEKRYYVTNLADEKMKLPMDDMPYLKWYLDRCLLIKQYFGEYTGTQLKNLQYKIDQYRDTTYREYIRNIDDLVRQKYYEEFGEML